MANGGLNLKGTKSTWRLPNSRHSVSSGSGLAGFPLRSYYDRVFLGNVAPSKICFFYQVCELKKVMPDMYRGAMAVFNYFKAGRQNTTKGT